MIGDGDPISTTQPRELHFAFSTMDWPALVCTRKHRLFFFFHPFIVGTGNGWSPRMADVRHLSTKCRSNLLHSTRTMVVSR